jgi:hypothetical protein
MIRLQKVKDRLTSLGSETVGGPPVSFANLIQRVMTRYAEIVNINNMKPE